MGGSGLRESAFPRLLFEKPVTQSIADGLVSRQRLSGDARLIKANANKHKEPLARCGKHHHPRVPRALGEAELRGLFVHHVFVMPGGGRPSRHHLGQAGLPLRDILG
jgi:uncharacterized protein (DUF362 family)